MFSKHMLYHAAAIFHRKTILSTYFRPISMGIQNKIGQKWVNILMPDLSLFRP